MTTLRFEPFSALIASWEDRIKLLEERIRVFEREGLEIQIKSLRSEQDVWRTAISNLRATMASATGQ